MAPAHLASGDALLDRADRAIADAIAIRARVQAGLLEAARRPIHRAGRDGRPLHHLRVESSPVHSIEPWWSVAWTLSSARDVIRDADVELEAAWRRVAPTIQTPITLIQE